MVKDYSYEKSSMDYEFILLDASEKRKSLKHQQSLECLKMLARII